MGEAVELVEVLEENWDTVMVFRRCRPSWITGMHAPLYDGIPSQEIEAAVRLLRIPAELLDEVLAGVDVMVSAIRAAYAESPK